MHKHGVGTISFYEPSTGNFAALGHGIVDIDTGDLVTIANGDITKANILSIEKGERGKPGEIRGSLINQSTVGSISKNTKFGIFGKLNSISDLRNGKYEEIPVATRDEIKLGKAKIICSIENNKTQEYEIEIQKIFLNNNFDNKSMLIKVTDDEAFETVRALARNEGMIVGSSSGAAMAAAIKLSKTIQRGNIVVVLPDRGDRYFSTGLFGI